MPLKDLDSSKDGIRSGSQRVWSLKNKIKWSMFTISCCNLKDFIFKSPKPWRFLETTFPLLCSSNIYLSTCLTSTMSYVPRKFQKYTTFYYYLFLFFCRHFFVYTTNFLDSWDTILDRTIQIQFPICRKKTPDMYCILWKLFFQTNFWIQEGIQICPRM